LFIVLTKWVVRMAGVAMVAVALGACSPTSTAPTPTRLDVTTVQVICGGAVPPPGQPACRSSLASRAIQVTSGKSTVVASGTSSADGTLALDVPAGQLLVSVPGALPYMNCDSPTVVAVAGQTTPVTQTCTILAP
jgi:hypothetical protein